MTVSPTNTCTVVVGFDQRKCGKPAVHTWTGRLGDVYHECADHVAIPAAAPAPAVEETAATLGLKTRSRRPFVLVAHGAIVGYADAVTPAVTKRAARLGARVLRTR